MYVCVGGGGGSIRADSKVWVGTMCVCVWGGGVVLEQTARCGWVSVRADNKVCVCWGEGGG